MALWWEVQRWKMGRNWKNMLQPPSGISFLSLMWCIYIYIHIYIWVWVKIKDLRGPQILVEFSINHPMIGVPNLTHVHIYVYIYIYTRKDLKGSCRNLYMRGPMVENCRKPWKAIWWTTWSDSVELMVKLKGAVVFRSHLGLYSNCSNLICIVLVFVGCESRGSQKA